MSLYVIQIAAHPEGFFYWGGEESYPAWGSLHFAYTYSSPEIIHNLFQTDVTLRIIHSNSPHRLRILPLKDAEIFEVMES